MNAPDDRASVRRQWMMVLTAVVLATVLAPVAAEAVGTIVHITDPVDESDQARVVDGHLWVTDDKPPLTVDGRVEAVNGRNDDSGAAIPLEIRGSVSTASPPRSPMQADEIVADGWDALLGPFSFRDRLAISSATVLKAFSGPLVTVQFYAVEMTRATCQRSANDDAARREHAFSVSFEGWDTKHLPFPQPMMVKTPAPGAETPWCFVSSSAGTPAGVTIVGRRVTSDEAPIPAPLP